jgi:hypothetical protein
VRTFASNAQRREAARRYFFVKLGAFEPLWQETRKFSNKWSPQIIMFSVQGIFKKKDFLE